MKMKAYIGLNRDMTCGGFKYKEGETYHINKTKLRGSGFHTYEYPLDMLAYYPLNSSVYHEVKLENVSSEYKNDTKSIKIGARMDIANLVKASVEYIMSKCDSSRRRLAMGDRDATFAIGDSAEASAIGHYSTASATGDYGAALSTGFQGTASTTGFRSAASVTGIQGVASTTGFQSAASATGNQGAAFSTGNWSATSTTGNQGVASVTGDKSAAFAIGYQSAASATGYQGTASADNPTAIAVAWGLNGRAKGVLGAHIVCAEWEDNKLICAKMAKVDGVTIKADTYYVLVNGDFVEVDE